MADLLSRGIPLSTTVPNAPLNQLLRRLEAATSRLEDIASSAQSFEKLDAAPPGTVPASSSAPELSSLIKSVPPQSPAPVVASAPSAPPASAAPSLPPTIQDMDDLMGTSLKKFVDSAQGLDKTIADQVHMNVIHTGELEC